jgi:hypothetical protein
MAAYIAPSSLLGILGRESEVWSLKRDFQQEALCHDRKKDKSYLKNESATLCAAQSVAPPYLGDSD